MKKTFTKLFALAAIIFPTVSQAQIVGANAVIKALNVEIGISGAGGFEGIATGGIPAGMHPRPAGLLGFVANPHLDAWATYDGDFFTPGTPENGWGIEVGSTSGSVASNNCTGPNNITGAITDWTYSFGCYSVDWEGDYITGGYNLHILVNYQLNESDLFYTTNVSVKNNGAATIPEFYYYRNVDPDNNQPISGTFVTQNTIVSQPTATCSKALVSATQASPWSSYLGFAAIGADFRVSYGGFSERDASNLWTGTGYTTAVGSTTSCDCAMALSYRYLNLAPGQTIEFKFVVILDAAAADNALNKLFYFNYAGALGGPAPLCAPSADTVTGCSGLPLQIDLEGTALADFNWTWSPATGLDTTAGTSVIASPTTPTLYTVTGTPVAATCFTTPIMQDIFVSTLPGPNIGMVPPGVQCNSYDLADLVFIDSNAVAGTIVGFLPNVPTTSTDTAGIMSGGIIYPGDSVYVFIGDPVQGCYDYELVVVDWSPGFSFDYSMVLPHCLASDGSITLSGITGTAPFTFDWSNGATTISNGSIPAGVYTVAVTDSGGCVEDTTINLPNITTLTSNIVIDSYPECGLPTGQITVTGVSGTPAYGYNIGAGVVTSGVFSSLPSGIYVIQVSDAAGCLIFDTIPMIDTSTIAISLVGSTNEQCGTGNGSITVAGLGGGTPYTYTLGGTTQTSALFDSLSAGTYSIIVTDLGGCQDTVTTTITDNATLVGSLVDTNSAICLTNNGTAEILGTNGGFTYTYTVGATSNSTGLFTGLASGSYTATIVSGTCTVNVPFVVGFDPGDIDLVLSSVVDENCGVLNGVVNTTTTGGTSPFNYTNNGGSPQTTGNYTGLNDGAYIVSVTDVNGCTDTIHATVNSIPIQIDLGPDIYYCNEYTITTNEVGSYIWTNEANPLVVLSSVNSVTVNTSGTYILNVFTPACADADTINITIVPSPTLMVPNVFTPNGDGYNDVFEVNGEFIETYAISIFNRWGQQVFSSNSLGAMWDGKKEGKLVDEGVYFYTIQYINPCEIPNEQTRNGTVQIFR